MRSKGSKLQKHVYVQRIKGHTYYRFRRAGGGSVRIPGVPGSPEFQMAYAKLLITPNVNIGRYSPGSVAHTIELYLRSAEFTQHKPATQRDYRRYLYRLDRAIGERAISSIEPDFVFHLRDRLRDTPIAANHAVAVIGVLFRFAVARKIVPTDITVGIDRLKGGDGYRRWTDADIEQFESCQAVPASMKLALALGLYTGQRLSDVIRMAWTNYDGKKIKVRQQKTGTRLAIPVHHRLAEMLDAIPRTGLMILATRTGLPYHPRVFSRDFLEARNAADLPKDLSFHGLRHTTAARLAELGAGAPEIQAITGHKSLKLVEHYIRQANQERQAERAIERLTAKPPAKQVLSP